jgi:hypothetical protein
MKASREMLEGQLQRYEEQLKGVNSFLKELKTMTAKHGTAAEQFEEDLIEAQNNAKYYEGRIAAVRNEIGNSAKAGGPQRGTDTILPKTKKQGIGSLIFSSISFVAGALLGSRLKSRKDSKDGSEGKG